MKLSCALVLTLTNLVIATPYSFSVKGSGASAKAGAVTAPFGTFGVVQPVTSNAGYTSHFSKSSSLSSASGGTALSSGSLSHNSAQDNRVPWPGYGTSFTTQTQAVGQNVLTFPQTNKNSITSFSDTSVVATAGANGQTEITGSYPSENSNDLYVNNSGAAKLQYQNPLETKEKNPSSSLSVSPVTSETYKSSKPYALNFATILKVPEQSGNFKETSKVQNVFSQNVTGGSAYITFPNAADGNTVPQTTVASSENYQIGEQKPNYNGGFGGLPGILKPFDKDSNVKSNDSANAFLTYKPNVELSAPVTTKPQGFNYTPENTIKPSYVNTNKGSIDTTKPTFQPLSSGSSNFDADISHEPERNPTYTFQIKPTFANNIGKPTSVLKPNDDQVHTLQYFDKIIQTNDGKLTQSFEGSSKPQFSSQIPSKFSEPTINTSQSKPINEVQVSVQAYPSNVSNELSEKLSSKPSKQSLYTGGFGASAGVLKPFDQLSPSSTFASAPVKSEVYNTSKPYLGLTVTGQKETTNKGGSSNILSATEHPSVVSTNYYTTPAPFISSASKTDKKDNVTTTVQTETKQPSNEPSQSSSFNLTYQKNPSLFNVAPSGVQSSTLGANSYPVKPQSQFPEKQVFEFGSQKKPLFSNSFGSFVTPKPTSYPGSTAYTSFSSLGYGNSGVSGSLDKSKPTSQFISTNQYKPSFTNSFGGQSGVLKPSNQPSQTSSTFISSNKPTNYKPFVTPSPLNTAKPNEEISVTGHKDTSIVNDFGTVSSLSQQSSDTASQKPSVVSTNSYTSPAPFISSKLPSSESNVKQHENAYGSTISSASKTDKKDNVTTTVQTETKQPSNEPSQSSSFNLTYQKNPSLFNVASSGVQSSTLGSNSYPVKPQSQFPEKQVFEFGSQKKPLSSNSFGTFVTPKPTSYPGSTAYTSFSSLGYGNSGVSGSLDKSKPTSQFISTNQYKPSFTNSFGGQSGVLKPSNQPSQTSSTFVSSNKPTNYKPFVTPSPLNTAKPNEEISITGQKDTSIVNDFGTASSLSQQSSDTASQKPSVVSTNSYTSPAPFISSKLPSSESNVKQHENASGSTISSASKTDKKDNVTTTVQTETKQPSNEPSQSSSFNLNYQKNPSLFNVASSGVQSSTLGSNSYPVKPQSQFPEKQVFEFGSQKKPLSSNSFGTFVTPKPTSYPGSTAYTSFSSLGYGNSGVSGSLEKSKPTSQFISTNQYKPSFTNSFGGQSGVLKPSNQPSQTSSTFISSNKPTNYKPFVTPSPLNTAKPNEEISVTGHKDISIVNDFGTVSSLSQQSSDTASQKPSVVSTNSYTSPAPFISSKLPSSESNVEQHENASGSTISSASKTDKKDNVTTTVQTETKQPSNEPSQSSSFNLTYQKNPSLFNVASSGVQSSTLGSNSYPVKPQSQFPEKQVFEFGLQKKPLSSNSFGTFVTPKPTSYPGSTAYTSFSSFGYGNSGVSGSLDKSKPTSQFISTNQYKPSFTNSFGGQSGVLKPSNQPSQTSSTFISSNKPTNYKPFVTPSPLNTAKPNEEISVTGHKDISIVNDFGTVSSLSQQSSDTASQKPSVVSTNSYTSPAPFISSKLPSSESNVEQHENASGSTISSASKTDKKDNVTTTVQTETKQPSNEPSQSSSFNLTYQKNPSLFNVASSGVQSSTLGSNSYPVKPQSQFPEKQVFEFGSQKKPLSSNSFGTFVTPKPTSYPGSTAYTSFSSLGYGNSGVSGSLDKSKPTSQFISTNQYKPSFTNSFGGQSGVLKPSNQPSQTSSTFISSNKPTNYKPFVTPSPLNTAKPNEEISVTGHKDTSIVNDFGTVSSLSQQSSDTASQKPSVVSTNSYTSPAPFISSKLPSSESNVKQHENASGSTISSASKTVLKPSNQPSQTSSTFISSNKPTNYKPFVTPSPLNIAKSNEEISVAGQKNSSIVKDTGKVSSLPQQSSGNEISSTSFVPSEPTHSVNTAGQSIASMTAGITASISSGSKFSESLEPATSKTPSLSEGYAISTEELNSSKTSGNNESEFLTKPSVETAPQEKPLYTSNSFSGVTGFSSSTASFGQSSSFVNESNEKGKQTSSFITTTQNKPQFSGSFGGQLGGFPSKEPYPIDTAFISSSTPLTSKPFVSPVPLNKSQQTITSQKVSELNNYNLESVTGFSELTKPPRNNGYQLSTSLVTPKPSDYGSFPSKTYSGTTSSSTAFTQQFPYKPLSGSSLGTSSVSRYSDQQKFEEKEKTGVYNTQKNTYVSLGEQKPTSQTFFTNSDFPTTGSAFISSSSQNKPQTQYSAKPTVQQTTQTKPSYSNIYQTFGAVKPFTYSYPGFSSSNFGHSSTFDRYRPFDITNQNSQFSSSWQYKPSYNWGQQKPNHPTPYSPTTFKPFTSFDKSKPSSTLSVTSQKQPSFAEGFGSFLSISEPTNQLFIDESAYQTANAKVSSLSTQKPTYFNPVSQISYKPFSVSPLTGGYSYSPTVSPMVVSTTSKYEIKKPISQTLSNGATIEIGNSTSSLIYEQQTTELSSQKPTAELVQSPEGFEKNYGNSKPTSQSLNYFNRPIDSKPPSDENKVITNEPTTSISQKKNISGHSETLNTNSTDFSNSQFASDYKVSSQKPISQLSLSGAGYEKSAEFSSDSKHQLLHAANLTQDTPKKSEYPSSLGGPYEESKPPKQFVGDLSYPSTLPGFEFNTDTVSGANNKLKPFKQVSTTAFNQYKPYEKPGYFDSAKPSFEVTTSQKESISVAPNGNQHSSDTSQSMTTDATGTTASEFPKTSSLDYGAQGKNDSKYQDASDKGLPTSQSEQSSYKLTYSTNIVSENSDEQKVAATIDSATQTNHVYPDSTNSAYIPSKSSSQQFSGNSPLFNIQQGDFHLSKPNIQSSVIGQPSSTTVQLPYAGGFGGPVGILKPNEFSAPVNHINIPSQYNPSPYNQALTAPYRELNSASYSGGFGGSSGVLKPVKNEKYTNAGNAVNDNKYFSIVHSSGLQGTLTENPSHSNYNLLPNKSFNKAQSNFEERNIGSKPTEEAQSGVLNQASVAATEGTGEVINHSHNVQNLENPFNNGASNGIGLKLLKNNKSFNDQISGLKIFRLSASNQGSSETSISSNAFGKSLAPGSAVAQGSSGFTSKRVFGRK